MLNRKNALFAGHDQGAENWARIASLIETCKLHSVDPQDYLSDVLSKLVNLWPAPRIDELMPWVWAAKRSTRRAAYASLESLARKEISSQQCAEQQASSKLVNRIPKLRRMGR